MANYKIATNGDVNAKMGTSLTPTDKCPTKSQLVAAGISIGGSYANNQLVRYDHVGRKSLTLSSYNKYFLGTDQSADTVINITTDADLTEHPLMIQTIERGNYVSFSDATLPRLVGSTLVYRTQRNCWSIYDLHLSDNNLYPNMNAPTPEKIRVGVQTSPGSGVFDTDYCNTADHNIWEVIGWDTLGINQSNDPHGLYYGEYHTGGQFPTDHITFSKVFGAEVPPTFFALDYPYDNPNYPLAGIMHSYTRSGHFAKWEGNPGQYQNGNWYILSNKFYPGSTYIDWSDYGQTYFFTEGASSGGVVLGGISGGYEWYFREGKSKVYVVHGYQYGETNSYNQIFMMKFGNWDL